MKLLLTSGGLTNKIIKDEFLKLVGKPSDEISVAFIITACEGVKGLEYVDEDLQDLRDAGVRNIKEVDISDPEEKWEKTLKNSDVIWIEGGNTFYLLNEFKKKRAR